MLKQKRKNAKGGDSPGPRAAWVIVLAALWLALGCSSPGANDAASPAESSSLEESLSNQLPASEAGGVDYSQYKVKYYPPSERQIDTSAVFEDERAFTIADFGPDGFLPAAVRNPSIYVVFSQPVVALSMLGKPSYSNDVLNITPPLTGVFRWYGTRMLSFEASEEVIPQAEYTVEVNGSILSLGGKELTGSRRFSFKTEPLAIVKIIPGEDPGVDLSDVPITAASHLTVVFNHPVNADVTTVYIDVLLDGQPVAFSYSRSVPEALRFEPATLRKSLVLNLQEPVTEAAQIDVVLREGARSEAAGIGSPFLQTVTLHTVGPFSFLDYSTESWTYPRDPAVSAYPVFLEFSHPVAEESLVRGIRTRPEVDITADQISVWRKQIMISGLPFEPESTYTLLVSESVEDVYGRSLGIPLELKIKVPEARKYAYFPNTGSRILEAEFPPRIAFEYQNVFDGMWRIGRINDPYRSFSPADLAPYNFSGAEKNVRHFEVLDLEPWLNEEGKGTVGISWNFADKDKKGNRPDWAQDNLQLQVTDLALTTRVASNRILVLVTSIESGSPVRGAGVAIMRGQDIKLKAETDELGLAVFELEPGDYNRYFQDLKDTWRDHLRIRATYGLDQVEFVPGSGHNPYRSGIYNVLSPLNVQRPAMETLIFTDRGLYRPGETLWFRGIDMDLYLGEYQSYIGPYTVEFKESRYNGDVLDVDEGFASSAGGFYGSFDMPVDLEPGYYTITYSRPDGQSRQTYFQVAVFENLKFQVTVSGDNKTIVQGDTISLDVEAGYLAGGFLTEGPYQFAWSKEPARFTPEEGEWSDFAFGPLAEDQRYFISLNEGELDGAGRATAEQKTTDEGIPGQPYVYQLEARVQDAGRQEIAARRQVFAHPASYYIGARVSSSRNGSWSTFVSKGEELTAIWQLVGADGSQYPAEGDLEEIEAGLYRIDWKIAQQQGVSGRITTRYEMVEELESSRTVKIDQSNGSVVFTPNKGGLYRIKFRTHDGDGRAISTDLQFYATGADWIRWGGSGTEIDLEADRELYMPGETATLLVKSPLPKGTYLITVEREKIFEEYVLDLDGSAQVIGIPVRDEYVPVMYVSVASYSTRTGEPRHTYFTPDLDKPKGYYGVIPIHVDTGSRRIDIDIDTQGMTYLPGGKAEITLRATHRGKPVSGAEITFLAVDRGVVDLIDYHVPDPVEYFYSESRFPLGVKGGDSRSLLIDPVTYEVRDLMGGDSEDGKGEGGTRSNFVPTAVFEPFLITDRDGYAKVSFILPDSLTTYRCTAVAADDGRFGYTEEELRVQQPINVFSLIPSLIRTRDTITAGVIVSNMDRSAHEVEIALEPGILNLDGPEQKSIVIEPGETAEVTFDLYADVAGETTVEFSIASEVLNERLIRSITVEAPLVNETVTTTGRTVEDEEYAALEGLAIPGFDSVEGGSVEISVSPSLISGLTSAMSYLVDYPHECFEQRASRLIPLLLFPDVAEELGVVDVRSFVENEIGGWATSQRENGGFPFWPESRYGESYYVSLRIAHVLKIAESKRYTIPSGIDRRPDWWHFYPNPTNG